MKNGQEKDWRQKDSICKVWRFEGVKKPKVQLFVVVEHKNPTKIKQREWWKKMWKICAKEMKFHFQGNPKPFHCCSNFYACFGNTFQKVVKVKVIIPGLIVSVWQEELGFHIFFLCFMGVFVEKCFPVGHILDSRTPLFLPSKRMFFICFSRVGFQKTEFSGMDKIRKTLSLSPLWVEKNIFNKKKFLIFTNFSGEMTVDKNLLIFLRSWLLQGSARYHLCKQH